MTLIHSTTPTIFNYYIPADKPAPHRCGLCNNPYSGGRADCPNNPTPPAANLTPYQVTVPKRKPTLARTVQKTGRPNATSSPATVKTPKTVTKPRQSRPQTVQTDTTLPVSSKPGKKIVDPPATPTPADVAPRSKELDNIVPAGKKLEEYDDIALQNWLQQLTDALTDLYKLYDQLKHVKTGGTLYYVTNRICVATARAAEIEDILKARSKKES